MRIPTIALTALMGLSLSVAAPAFAQNDGLVKITEVSGPVSLALPDGTSTFAEADKLIDVGTTIQTLSNASAVLLFSNGTVVEMEPDSTLEIVRFTSDDDDLTEKDRETAVSTTLLRIEEGEVTAEVPNLFDGSVWEIESEAGTAGVRGTTVSYSRQLTASGESIQVVGYDNGDGYFVLPDGTEVEVADGFEIVLGPDGYDVRPKEAPALGAREFPEPPEPETEQDLITPQFGLPES